MNETEILVKLEGHEHEIKSLKYRMNKAEEVVDAIHSLTVTTATLAQSVEANNQDVKEIKGTLDKVIQEPADNWRKLTGAVVAAIASGLVGIALGAIISLV